MSTSPEKPAAQPVGTDLAQEAVPGIAPQLYPSRFPLKIFVNPDPVVEARIERLFRDTVGSTRESEAVEVARRPSPTGKYLCLTLTFTAENLAHAERIVKTVSADPAVVLAL